LIDLSAYFRRIGIERPAAPNLAALKAIHLAHPAAIPFENLDPLLGRPPKLAPAALQAKIVEGRRGGYCFEQNAVLREVLTGLGFSLTALAGRVVWGQPPDAPLRPRSHMLLKVDLPEGAFIADVGFGGFIATAPLRLEPGLIQETPNGRMRITETDGLFAVEGELPGGFAPAYRFDLMPHLPIDYEPLNWFTATNPASIFPRNLMAERATPELRASLLNDRLTLRRPGEEPEARRILDAADFATVMSQVFLIDLPASAEEVFARVPQGLEGPA
jgi:N-hydroxyarylamine O-acetyltransferase